VIYFALAAAAAARCKGIVNVMVKKMHSLMQFDNQNHTIQSRVSPEYT